MALCIHCTLNCAGGRVVHSYGRLIPHEFPITDLQQISGPDGIGRINCTVSSGTARFAANGGQLETGGVFQTRNGSRATLIVNPSNVGSFQNSDLYCTNLFTNFFYLSISSASKFPSHYCIIIIYIQRKTMHTQLIICNISKHGYEYRQVMLKHGSNCYIHIYTCVTVYNQLIYVLICTYSRIHTQ